MMGPSSASRRAGRLHLLAIAVLLLGAPALEAQQSYTRGQSVSPAYEGWRENEDGTFSLLFGYMNRNWQEELDVPAGPENFFSPGPADQGQPTHFLPRRNRFVFEVRVPADFGDGELVWTLTTNGETERAYASLHPEYLIDDVVIASETGALGAGTSSPEMRANIAPVVQIEGEATRRARVGVPITLVARVIDDGGPTRRGSSAAGDAAAGATLTRAPQTEEEMLRNALRRPSRITVNKALGLHFAWFVYRGSGDVTFDPIQIKTWEDTRANANSPWAPNWFAPPVPEDGRWIVRATFHEPGTYVLQGRADDGALYGDARITIHVEP